MEADTSGNVEGATQQFNENADLVFVQIEQEQKSPCLSAPD